MVRIKNILKLDEVCVSKALLQEFAHRDDIEIIGALEEMKFKMIQEQKKEIGRQKDIIKKKEKQLGNLRGKSNICWLKIVKYPHIGPSVLKLHKFL
ncbi:hypothetical protein ES707_10406 [subsurface metagenome]